MKRSRWTWAGVLLVAASLVVLPEAQAAPKGKSRISASRSATVRTPSRTLHRSQSLNLGSRSRSRSNASRNSFRAPSGNRTLGKGILGEALRQELGRHVDDNRYRRGGGFLDYLNDRDEARSDAYRDALIADTIVQVVGIIASTAQPRVVTPAPRVVAPTPGHYEIRRIKIRDGYWESQQVWVPDYQDPASGAVIEGHYETHKRWVPEVYQETKVWVPHQTPVP